MIKNIHKTSKVLLSIFIVFSISMGLLFLKDENTVQNLSYMTVSTLIFVLLIWIDMFKVLGSAKAIWFIAISALISLFSEYLGVNGCVVFSGTYQYNHAMGIALGGVPLIVIAMWTAVVYICYRIAVLISNKKEALKNKSEEFIRCLIIALLSGLMAVSWDLVWDPLAVKANTWAWNATSPYFGIPLYNFTSWIIIVFLSVSIFQLTTKNDKKESNDIVVPFLGYFYIFISTFILAFHFNQPHFALLAFIIMSPYLLITILLKLKK